MSYAYSFFKTDDLEEAASIGVHWFDLKLGLAGQSTVDGVPVTSASQVETVAGPLGIHADHAISPNWEVGAHAQFFGLDYDDYAGDLLDLRSKTEYWFSDSIGAGLGFTW